jgi:hypothetical protein
MLSAQRIASLALVTLATAACTGQTADDADADADADAETSQAATVAKETVVFVGDSVSMDSFGVQMQRSFLGDARVEALDFYAGCGTKPGNWLRSVRGSNPYVTKCGYWEKHPDGSQVRKEWSRFGTPSHAVPYLEDILARTKPTLVVLQLGLNMMDTENPNTAPSETWLTEEFTKTRRALESTAPSASRLCVWIAPNETKLWPKPVQDTLVRVLKQTVEPACLVIDGRELTQESDVSGDGYHLHGRAATRFAEDAFGRIKLYVNKQRGR